MRKHTLVGAGCGHFVTFSTLGRRALLATPRARQIVIGHLGRLADEGRVNVTGFVVMPDHVHAVLWFSQGDRALPEVMKVWKAGASRSLREFFARQCPDLLACLQVERSGRVFTAVWQRRYYDFNLFTTKKVVEKLDYMYYNPVKKGLCKKTTDWLWSSARWYDLRKSVGIKLHPEPMM